MGNLVYAIMNNDDRLTVSRTLLSIGFRPFFLLGGAFALISMAMWGISLSGHLPGLTPLWHGHEMVFGYGGAVIAGFVLTAATNWTGRPTLSGVPLLILILVWIAARVAAAFSGTPIWLNAMLASGFFIYLAIGVGTPVFVVNNRRNYVITLILAVLAFLDVYYWTVPLARSRTLFATLIFVLVLVALIGGRILPNFTKNAIPGLRVRPSQQLRDQLAMASLVVLSILILIPGISRAILAIVAIFAALMHGFRMYGWGGSKTLRRPLLTVLHAAYACIPIGLLLLGICYIDTDIPFMVPVHVLGIGAFGLMTVGMMTRVTLGHTGRALKADYGAIGVYVLVMSAMIVRAIGPFMDGRSYWLFLLVASTLWCVAFLVFLLTYGPRLLAPRVDKMKHLH